MDGAQADANYSGPRTLDGRPAPESQSRVGGSSRNSGTSTPARRQPPRGGITTLGDLGAGSSHAGHGHDEDSDEDDEQPRDLYAGGEKSGQFVQDPSKPSNDPRKLVNAIMKKAQAYVLPCPSPIIRNLT